MSAPQLSLLIGLSFFAGGHRASAEHLRLFVLTGQSNCLGTTASSETDVTPGIDPSDARVRLFWHNVADAATTIGDSGGHFLPLCPQQGGHYPGSKTHWGPEFGFSRTLFRAGVRNLGIIKVARGGGGNTNWSKTANGHMYQQLLKAVQAATEQLNKSGHTFEIVGLLYAQGESDSNQEAAEAGNRFLRLRDNLRADLPHASRLHAVIAGVAAAGGSRDLVRSEHQRVAAADRAISFVSTADLRGHLYDRLHFDREAKLDIGRRLALAMIDAGVITPAYGRLTCIGDSITQGGKGFPSYRYQLFRRLAASKAVWQFVGSQHGAYEHNPGSTPDIHGIPFPNIHEGHWGWRAYWINGRLPLPANRVSENRGTGTLLTWTGLAENFQLAGQPQPVPYQGRHAVPDTAIVMIGSNDLSEGTPTAWRNRQLTDDIEQLVRQLQQANARVTVFVSAIPRVGSRHSAATWLNESIGAFNRRLPEIASDWSTATSTVFTIPLPESFDPDTMMHDAVHPNATGELVLATGMTDALGLPDDSQAGPTQPLQTIFSGKAIDAGLTTWTEWSELNPGHAQRSLAGQVLTYDHAGQTVAAMIDGSHVPAWKQCVGGSWTLDLRCRIRSAEHGIAVWAGTGTARIILIIRDESTTSHAERFHQAAKNSDGQFHHFRIAYDAATNRYRAWRDDAALTTKPVLPDQATADNRLLIGDYTSAGFGDGFSLEIEEIRLTPQIDRASLPN